MKGLSTVPSRALLQSKVILKLLVRINILGLEPPWHPLQVEEGADIEAMLLSYMNKKKISIDNC